MLVCKSKTINIEKDSIKEKCLMEYDNNCWIKYNDIIIDCENSYKEWILLEA